MPIDGFSKADFFINNWDSISYTRFVAISETNLRYPLGSSRSGGSLMKKPSEIMNRRELILSGGLVTASTGAAVGVVVKDRLKSDPRDPTGEATIRKLGVLRNVKPQENEDDLIRMQRELVTAMAKPVEKRRWIMLIDQKKCVGCSACTVGCIAENKLPPGVVYRPVVTQESGKFPNVRIQFLPRPCMQCDNPSCTPVCPVKATGKRPDGVVAIDYDKCIGCWYCLNSCPYGARTSDFGRYYSSDAAVGAPAGADRPVEGPKQEYQHQPNNEYGKRWKRDNHGSPVGNARKCHFCLHRLEAGMLPACVTTCIGRATYFGDSNDPDSLAVELITKHNVQTWGRWGARLAGRPTRGRAYHQAQCSDPDSALGKQASVLLHRMRGGRGEMAQTRTGSEQACKLATASRPWKTVIWIFWRGLFIAGAVGLVQRLSHGHLLAGYGSYVPWGLWIGLYCLGVGVSGGLS
jgi:molybdopterin-containing oxidoreductase family iron-sulfur binding subunit